MFSPACHKVRVGSGRVGAGRDGGGWSRTVAVGGVLLVCVCVCVCVACMGMGRRKGGSSAPVFPFRRF